MVSTDPMSSRVYSATQFNVLEELGHGAYGSVYHGVDKVTGLDVAIKQIDLESDENILEFKREITLLSTCNDDNITKYYGCFVKGFKLWIVMEYLPGGSLSDLLVPGPIRETAIVGLCRDIVLGLHYLHNSGKIHRDLKPANILVSEEGFAKIADFGVSTQLSNKLSLRTTYIGTPYYMAPEVILHHQYNFKLDIWSLGITLLELAHGKPPLYQYHPMQAVYLIEKNDPPRLIGDEFSESFKDFIACCLQRNPNERPTTKQLMKHKFLNSAKISPEQTLKLVERKRKWDLKHANGQTNSKKYYTPTVDGNSASSSTSEDTTEFDFDIESFDNQSQTTLKAQKTASITPNSENGTLELKPKLVDSMDVGHNLSTILNQSFNKISAKINLSTYQYDRLVSFKTGFINDGLRDENKKNRDIFQIFFKNFLKRLYNSNDQQLKEQFLPKVMLENQKELKELRNEVKMLREKANEPLKTFPKEERRRDHVEELLLSRWAEGMIEKWTR